MKIEEIEVPWTEKYVTPEFSLTFPKDAKILCVYRRDQNFYMLYAFHDGSQRVERKFTTMICADENTAHCHQLNIDTEKFSFDYVGGDTVYWALTNKTITSHFFELKEK